ncbi:uncharacterized protein LOC142929264 [Petromyzon marinus]|uniref:uncharacterized protein LOC142929264 n=1 Tax=Petromyzon marinus TaxID=7757 RepID=UPI003F6F9A74
MDTRSTNRSQEPQEEDGSPGIAPEAAADDPGMSQTPQQQPPLEEWPPMEDGLQAAHSRLAELLYAAASTLEEINRAGLRAQRRQRDERRSTAIPAETQPPDFGFAAMTVSATAIGGSQRHVDAVGQSAVVTSSPTDARCQDQSAGASSSPARPPMGVLSPSDTGGEAGNGARHLSETKPSFQQRLPVLKEFVSDGGDWGAFQRRFLAHQEMAGWTDNEALSALPAMLDDDALATLITAPRSTRSTLQSALQVLTIVYGPSSDCRKLFHERCRGQKEPPLAYRTALLALAKAAFPRMDGEGVDAMVTEKLLALAQELQIVIVAEDDADMCSLRAARHIHAHLIAQRRSPLVPKGAAAVCAGTPTIPPSEEVFAAGRPVEWRSGGRPARTTPDRQEHPKALITCYNCGRKGHVAAECRAPRQRQPGRSDGAPAYRPPHRNPASRGTPHARPVHTPVPTSRVSVYGPRGTPIGLLGGGGVERVLGPGQWTELAHRIVAASAGSSVVAGHIDGVEVRILVDTGASATIVSDLIYNILPVQSRPLLPVTVPCYAANGGSLGIIGQIRAQICIGDIKLSGPILVSSSLAVPCLLGTDFLGKMPIKILIDQGCIELPSGRRVTFLPSPVTSRAACASIQAFVTRTVRVPPGAQMLVPLRLRRPFVPGVLDQGILLGPSRAGENGLDLVAAQTLVKGSDDPFILVLNVGVQTAVVPQGTVLAHATPVPVVDTVMGNVGTDPLAQPHSEGDDSWMDTLCSGTSDLSDSQRAGLRTLLTEFSDVFSKHKYDIGCTKLLRHHIDTGDNAPVRQNPFRLSPAEKDHVKLAVDDMLAADIIAPSTSPWGAPIVLVKKHDGSLRFCVDFRRLNKISVADAYPLPRMDESLDALAGARFFSTLDLLSGFWQLPLDDESKPKTAFRTPHGLFQFNRLPMGLHSAPATFQRLMELVLAGLQWNVCLIYLDDVIVFSKTFDEHLLRLRAVFLKMRAANLKFKPQKCHLLRESVRYLGHIVSRSGISTDPAKTQCVNSWPTPTSVAEVRSFIGFASYYRRFVADFATIAKPLHALTAKGVKFHWGQEEEVAFCSLRDALVRAPPLSYPDFSEPFLLDTDASNTGIGGVLSQVICGVERVVAYGSRVLSPAEQRYCVTRRELLAIVFFMQQYRPYLYGRHFTVRTDHAALQYALRVTQPSGQLSRWLEILQDYDFTTTYRKGARHTNADALSRLPPASDCACLRGSGRCKPPEDSPPLDIPVLAAATEDPLPEGPVGEGGADSLLGLSVAEWGRLQMEDASLLALRRRAGGSVRGVAGIDSYGLLQGLLMHWDGRACRHRLVVPSALRGKAVWAAHERLLHLGTHKTLAVLQLDFFWPGMARDVDDLLGACTQCAQRKPPAKGACPPLQSITVSRVNELVALDILGPFPATPRGNKYLLVGVEYFTRWPMAWPLANQSAAAVAEAFVQGYVLDKGAPERLLTDQGKNFSGVLLHEVCALLGTKKIRTSPYHPQTDGMVERLHRTLTSMLCHQVCDSQTDWDLHIPGVLAAYRMAPHAATGFSPFFLMYGRDVDPPIANQLRVSETSRKSKLADHVKFNILRLTEAREAAAQNSSSRQKANERLRSRQSRTHAWKPGDQAWLHCPQVPLATSAKLLRPWRGPVVIVKVMRPQCVRIQWGKRRWYVHPSRLKPFVAPRVPPPHYTGRACDVSADSRTASSSPALDASLTVPPSGASRMTASSAPAPPGGDGVCPSGVTEDGAPAQPVPTAGPTGPSPYDGPANRTRAKMRRLL